VYIALSEWAGGGARYSTDPHLAPNCLPGGREDSSGSLPEGLGTRRTATHLPPRRGGEDAFRQRNQSKTIYRHLNTVEPHFT
jgi:hypothetical protein